MVSIETNDGVLPAFLSCPVGDGPFAAVIVVMEAFGLNEHIKRVASRLAGKGYVTIAPGLYYRQRDPVIPYDQIPEAVRLMSGLSDSAIVADISAVVTYLQRAPFVRGDRIGMTGFCMGGRVTFLVACQNPAIRAAVPFYGGGIARVTEPNPRTPRAPLEYADQLTAPMLLFFGENDPFIPLDDVQHIRQRLTELGKAAEVVVYPGAPHGFFCDERDSYRAEAASDAWTRLCAFLRLHLGC